jgi:GTP-binding protein
MRREGFELQVSAPEVIFKQIDGKKNEPMEYVLVDVDESYQGAVMSLLGNRKAELQNMHHYDDGRTRMEYIVSSRALLGFRNQFLTETRGTGIINFSFHGYEPYKGEIVMRNKGALVSMEKGEATSYALNLLQERGTLFIKPGDKVYDGMIIGENSRDSDMSVNPCKTKKLTNMRSSGTDDLVHIEPPRQMTLERCMEWIMPDELIEITPEHVRLRKRVLHASKRK